MDHRRTLTMSWDGLGDDEDDDRFFESCERLSTAVPSDHLASSGSEDDEHFDDSRLSFASCISSSSFHGSLEAASRGPDLLGNYDLWMAEPGDVQERRKRLLQGMGLSSNKDLLKLTSANYVRAISRKVDPDHLDSITNVVVSTPSPQEPSSKEEPSRSTHIVLVRSRSDGDILSFSVDTKKRKEELIGPISKQRLTRTSSGLVTPSTGTCHFADVVKLSEKSRDKSSKGNAGMFQSILSTGGVASFFLIKNLDTGTEFIVKEYNDQGMWNKLSDLQTGKQLTMEEFEKTVGYSPVVKELMCRENVSRSNDDDGRKLSANSYFTKSFRNSKRRGVALLKNIKEVANSMGGLIADKERENASPVDQKANKNTSSVEQKANKNPSPWVKVRQHGRSYKEFTALHMSQEIQAHEGSIWTIKFSTDSRYLASAGEDRVIHVWEVQECDVMSVRPAPDDLNSVGGTPIHPMAGTASDRPPLEEITPLPSEKRKKGRTSNKKKGSSIPDYVNVPETVVALSEKPVCTFNGHQDDVLDLCWSRSQVSLSTLQLQKDFGTISVVISKSSPFEHYMMANKTSQKINRCGSLPFELLLSSSMDKTVRMWDMETKSCLKLFAHNDYVTCIQFNPMDDDYFISGSLDAKVRIWNVPDRQVVDWTDLHEMVTAACYTPDAQGAIIGSHKGSCRRYNISDSKLEYKDFFEVQNKKKAQVKKVTGFQFSPCNPAEVLITSADSRIRIFDGTDVIHKFRGMRNTSSQISASFSPEGKYVISASEDSQVYIWKREDSRNSGAGKGKTMISSNAYEHFHSKDVSVAVPWPGSIKHEPPIVELHSKRNHSKRPLPPPYPTTATSGSPTREENSAANSRRQLPPLPRKNNVIERSTSCQEEDSSQSSGLDDSRIDSGIGDSFDSAASSSIRYGESPSISASQSWSTPWSLLDGSNSHGGSTVQATAWGLAMVTASLGGEIRVYQNFGLPLKVSRQTNLFRDLT